MLIRILLVLTFGQTCRGDKTCAGNLVYEYAFQTFVLAFNTARNKTTNSVEFTQVNINNM